ncbi:MAG: glycoside hydrolase family 38 C-terminal domain-containing protein [Streptosporangiaceae bacterium]
MRITGVESTDLFVGTAQHPLQVVRVTLESDRSEGGPDTPATVHVEGPGVRNHGPFLIKEDLSHGDHAAVEIPIEPAVPYQPGSTRHVTVTVESQAGRSQAEADITVAEPGWTMWMVSHFHYDPVWWNTQGQFTEARLTLADEEGRLPDVRNAFELVRAHLDKARTDGDYKFVLAEIDYLKPYFDTYPQDRQDLRRLICDGRVEIVGGNYNEPNTNLTSAESTIRNAVYGIGYQRDVAGGDPRSAWMLDAFGHDPGYPGLMAAAGLTSSAWARGPFHQWGPSGAEGGGNRRMQFSSEFEWISPDGRGLLTHYMAQHYGAGWRINGPQDLPGAELEAYGQFRLLAQVAATPNVLLPVGSDHVIPARWVTDIHRDWNQRYVWPRFVTAVPREFFAAVRAAAGSGEPARQGDHAGPWITPQTRDMNPVYTGKDVSYIDTKQAQRAIETVVSEAERFATMAWLEGGSYPDAELDRVWRILAFGAHHDGITGVESDQVYLDLAGTWREAFDLSASVRREALSFLVSHYDGEPATGAVVVFNGLARARDGIVRVTVNVAENGTRWLDVRDDDGARVGAVAEGVIRHEDGSLAEVTLTFVARGVPGLGYRTYLAVPVAAGEGASSWEEIAGTAIENAAYVVTADPQRGGTVGVTDKRSGLSVLAGRGNELVVQDEYPKHPRHGEGPWHLAPKGAGIGSSSVAAGVRAERCAVGARLVSSFTLEGVEVIQETTLYEGSERVEFRTYLDGYGGKDRLFRVRFPGDVPGGLPVYQTATAVIGRPFGVVDVDSSEHWYTLDNPAYQWFGVGSTARVRLSDGQVHAIGVAEVVCPDSTGGLRSAIRDLMAGLAAAGVTATCSQADGPRYGAIDVDSNLPDVRIAVGGPEANTFTSEVLSAAGPGYAKALAARMAEGTARVWVPGARSREDAFGPDADLRGAGDLPVLIVAGAGPDGLASAVAALAADMADAVADAGDPVDGGPADELADRSVALLNRGTPGGVVTPDGTLYMSLMRSCSAWPSSIWIDGDRRTAPDGSSFAWQHWSHTFEYALASGDGDWRAAGLVGQAEDYNHDLVAVLPARAPGAGPRAGLLSVEPANVTVSAVKPRGNPFASGGTAQAAGHDGVLTIRLRETAGIATTARIRMAAGVSAAWLTDLLEESDGAALPVTDGAVQADLPPFGTVTLRVQANARTLPDLEPDKQRRVPVYARYWLHGTGPAPAGNLPVAVHLSPVRVALTDPGQETLLRLTVGCAAEGASGEVELVTPERISVTADRAPGYRLEPGGYAAWDLTVRAAPGTAPGRYFVAARIGDGRGGLIEDAAMVAVGEPLWPDPELPPEEAIMVMQADYQAGEAEVELAVATQGLELAPGGNGELLVSLTSRLASELRGEAQLVSPFGSWPLFGHPAQDFSVAPQATAVLRFGVNVPADTRPGSRWWALVKVMYYGRVRYSQAVPVVISAATGDYAASELPR